MKESTAAPASTVSAEQRFDAEVRSHLRRNYLAHLAHGLLGQTGMRLLNAPTFIPAYVFALSGSELAVGVARGLQYLGMFLSPIVGATVIEHRRRVLPVGFTVGALMRVQILGLALAGLFLAPPGPLYACFLFLGLFGVFLGVQGVVFNFLVSKVVPVDVRGRLMGLRNALSGLTAFAVSLYAGSRLIEDDVLGNGYAATFLLAFALTSVGLLMLLFVREPESPGVRQATAVTQRLRELPALLRQDPEFTRYFLARALAVTGRMAMPFYILYAQAELTISATRLGELTAAFVLAQSVGNLGWGAVADRAGFRAVFLASLSTWMLSAVALLATSGYGWLLLVFVGLGAGQGGFQMSAQNLVLEFGSRQNLPLRIAVANSASELVAAVGAVGGGARGLLVSHTAVFLVAITAQSVAIALVFFGVREPRTRPPRG
ncbi:MAG: MFS transporter [Myxococcota bacterium]